MPFREKYIKFPEHVPEHEKLKYSGVKSYKEFIDRFEEWIDADQLDQIKNEKLPDESRNFLLHNELETWFLEQAEDKPWQSWQPTQKQMNVFTGKHDLPYHNVHEVEKRHEARYEFGGKDFDYYYNRSTHVFADLRRDAKRDVVENIKETEVNFTYGRRLVLRDTKGRFVKHLKDSETGKWLI